MSSETSIGIHDNVRAMLRRLGNKKDTKAILMTGLRRGVGDLLRRTRAALMARVHGANTPSEHNTRFRGKILTEGVRAYVNERTEVVRGFLDLDDPRLNWLENGTAERTNNRTTARYRRRGITPGGASRGRVTPRRFFADSIGTGETTQALIEQAILQGIQKLENKE